MQMAWHFETPPETLKPPMTQTIEVGRCNDQASASWPQPALALPQQLDRIGNMLDDVAENNQVKAGFFRNIGNRAVKNLKPPSRGIRYGGRIRIHARHSPAERAHMLHEVSVPATNIKQGSGFGGAKSQHVEGVRSCDRSDPRQQTGHPFI